MRPALCPRGELFHTLGRGRCGSTSTRYSSNTCAFSGIGSVHLVQALLLRFACLHLPDPHILALALASALKHLAALNRIQPDVFILLAGTVTITLSSLAYVAVEKPLNAWFRSAPWLPKGAAPHPDPATQGAGLVAADSLSRADGFDRDGTLLRHSLHRLLCHPLGLHGDVRIVRGQLGRAVVGPGHDCGNRPVSCSTCS